MVERGAQSETIRERAKGREGGEGSEGGRRR